MKILIVLSFILFKFFFESFRQLKMDIGNTHNVSQSDISKGNKVLVNDEKADRNTKVCVCHKKF